VQHQGRVSAPAHFHGRGTSAGWQKAGMQKLQSNRERHVHLYSKHRKWSARQSAAVKKLRPVLVSSAFSMLVKCAKRSHRDVDLASVVLQRYVDHPGAGRQQATFPCGWSLFAYTSVAL